MRGDKTATHCDPYIVVPRGLSALGFRSICTMSAEAPTHFVMLGYHQLPGTMVKTSNLGDQLM